MERREGILVGTAALLVFSRVFGLSLVLPGFVAYAEGLRGATPLLVGIGFGAYGLTLALMQFPMGWLSDRLGRQPILLLGTAFFVIGSAWAATATSMESLIAARLVQGLGAVSSTAMAMVGESVAPQRRTLAMAMVGIPAGLGFFAGLLAAGLLAPVLAFPDLFWIAAAVGAVAGLPLPWLKTGRVVLAPASPLGASVVTLAAAGFVMNFCLTTVLFYLGLGGRSEGTILLAPLVFALAVMALASRAIDRRRLTWQPVLVGLLVLATGAAATILPGAPWWRIGAAVFFAAHATMAAVLPSQVSRIAGASGGRGHGIQNVVAYSGTFAAGVMGGAFSHRPEVALGLLGLLAAAVAVGSLLRLRAEAAARPEPSRRMPQP